MESISSKAVIKDKVAEALRQLQHKGADAFIISLQEGLLNKKVKFPLLEYAAMELMTVIPEDIQLDLADRIVYLRAMGGQVLVGIMLRLRLDTDYERTINKACDYISFGNEWYVCDIIGERVLGYALLTKPEMTIPILDRLALHPDKWLVRTVGVATHYAVKKKLQPPFVEQVFRILLQLSTATDFHSKKGIGWGAKTVARFHPALIDCYQDQIVSIETKQWFRTKINIGLNRSRGNGTER
ncbi:DNA alkylation repair protein [Sphingobacterium sp. SYP-B4668]|uniref:DNA alkylation repair protein n=1 Tax=Sphingobacterium sp. SYP-B4668 TaxID=2996035 RepID=UPI0022DE5FC5|nr:DNA alkylation repair protein [Sphingobacterium sp. SYP-B4668]